MQKENTENFSMFVIDLCEALIPIKIPIHKLDDSLFSKFLEKYIGIKRKDPNYYLNHVVENIYQKQQDEICPKFKDLLIYLMFDETTDVLGRYVPNIFFGECSEKEEIYLLLLEQFS